MIIAILTLTFGFWLGFRKGQIGFKRGVPFVDKEDCYIFGIHGILFAIMALVVFYGVMSAVAINVNKQSYVEYGKVKIVALKNSQSYSGSINGNFLVFTGQVDSRQYYFFYYLLPDGGKKLGKVNAEEATIYEETRSDAYLVKNGTSIKYKEIAKWETWLFYPKFLQLADRVDFSSYAIHVPEGTVKRELKLDLKDLN